jgi:phosphohistidine phosphatase SixA
METNTMDLIIIRHGTKIPTEPDKDSPLAPEGLAEIDRFKERMVCLGINPQVYLTSKYVRARQTAERLASDPGLIRLVDALTPESKTFHADVPQILSSLSDEARKQGIDLDQLAVIALVGHEPQLSIILAHVTSKSGIGKGTGVFLTANSFSAFLKGKGTF